jgi:ABC-type molybdate transport system permease subunit
MLTVLYVVGLVAFNLVLGFVCGWAMALTRSIALKALFVVLALPLVLAYGIALDRVLP